MSGFFFQSSGTPHNLCKDTFETMVHMVVEWGKNASMFEKTNHWFISWIELVLGCPCDWGYNENEDNGTYIYIYIRLYKI